MCDALHNLINGHMSHQLLQRRAVKHLVIFSLIGAVGKKKGGCATWCERGQLWAGRYRGVCRSLRPERSRAILGWLLKFLLKLLNMNLISVLSCLGLLLAAAAAQHPKPCGECGPQEKCHFYNLCVLWVKLDSLFVFTDL